MSVVYTLSNDNKLLVQTDNDGNDDDDDDDFRWLQHWHASGIPSILFAFTAKSRWAHVTSLSATVCLTASETIIFCFLRDVPSVLVRSSTYVTSFISLLGS